MVKTIRRPNITHMFHSQTNIETTMHFKEKSTSTILQIIICNDFTHLLFKLVQEPLAAFQFADFCLRNALLLDRGVGLRKSGGRNDGTLLVCVAYWAVAIVPVWSDWGSYLLRVLSRVK
jgi:hypothetical protein